MTSEDLRLELDRLGDLAEELTEELAELRRKVRSSERVTIRLSNQAHLELDALAVPIQEAARLAGIGVNEVRELVRSGRISSVPVGDTGYRRVIPVAAIAEFLNRAAEGGEATS